MALVVGTQFDDLMTPTIGQFTQDGNVIDRPANKTTSLVDLVFGLAGDDFIDGGGGRQSRADIVPAILSGDNR